MKEASLWVTLSDLFNYQINNSTVYVELIRCNKQAKFVNYRPQTLLNIISILTWFNDLNIYS